MLVLKVVLLFDARKVCQLGERFVVGGIMFPQRMHTHLGGNVRFYPSAGACFVGTGADI